ncbi:hypothetical protein TPHA_0D01360 [Tetrapisispora phaffii CBS 4417]|uniref:Sulfurtransferase n=1 Tax=Tetrapisispora phaffii (strain ATCC 24235 / CBS 4417 / NBRC 1672 / NRRL Y-8282 / UCD 70-5) TaxID=1071381 RepID=G8BSF6_TETPH|nr:hypothetical protein TPHA_0D01360 [Tetrapisispora phaffii CBS 4417]CCE62777.1 hypothetical protein TPHA_0D01360 [Tetrapisispora phaffii CBS 4417]
MSGFKLLTPIAFDKLLKGETTHRVIPIDATWFLPSFKRSGAQEFLTIERIPNAIHFDIDTIKDPKSIYPHMAPDLETFNKSMSKLGLKRDDILVVYDRIGNFSAPRCAWTLSLFGHENVYLLNNFLLYKKEGYPVDNSVVNSFSQYPETQYKSDINLSQKEIIDFESILKLVNDNQLSAKYNAYDARALNRFEGKVPEPRPDIPSGHIPGFQPLPFTDVLEGETGTYPSSTTELKAKINKAMENLKSTYDPKKPTIVMCGTGVTGIIIKTALEQSGIKDVKCYDGSWTEWALRTDKKIIANNRD